MMDSETRERLTDSNGVPKAYTMVQALEQAKDDFGIDEAILNGDIDENHPSYISITGDIRRLLMPFLGMKHSSKIQDLLLEQEFDQVYSILDEHWEESVRETMPEEQLEDWQPDQKQRERDSDA